VLEDELRTTIFTAPLPSAKTYPQPPNLCGYGSIIHSFGLHERPSVVAEELLLL